MSDEITADVFIEGDRDVFMDFLKKNLIKNKIEVMYESKEGFTLSYKPNPTITEAARVSKNTYNNNIDLTFHDTSHISMTLRAFIEKITALHESHLSIRDSYSNDDPDLRSHCDRISSATLFTSTEIKKYGKDKLLKAPCELIEELENGAIFMMIHKDRFSSTYEERKKLREYLGEHEHK